MSLVHEWHEIPMHGGAPSEYRCRLCGFEWIANGVSPEPRCQRVTATITPHEIPHRDGTTMVLLHHFTRAEITGALRSAQARQTVAERARVLALATNDSATAAVSYAEAREEAATAAALQFILSGGEKEEAP